MTHWTTQDYQGPQDLETLLSLVKARPVEWLLDYPSPADLRELLQQADIQQATRLWKTAQGDPIGYALLNYGETFAHLAFECLPEFSGSTLASDMVAWGEDFFQHQYHGQAEELSSSARAEQAERVALLEKCGFQPDTERAIKMARDLNEPIAVPCLPEGFTFQAAGGGVSDAAWVAMHQAAFGTKNLTEEDRQAMRNVPDYDPALDLVVLAPDGSLAAYVVGAIHPEENEWSGQAIGFTDPVATHPAYQRLGLARALLLECLHRLKARGMTSARLGTDSENLAMQRTAEAVGFRKVGEVLFYAKKFRQA